MGHWVTLDDDQHVYISGGGKVLATRGAISSGAGGKDRGKALAARSKAAIGKATGKSRPSLREQADAHRSGKGTRAERAAALHTKAFAAQKAAEARMKPGPDFQKSIDRKNALIPRENKLAAIVRREKDSPATTRAIEHAKNEADTFKLIQRSAVGAPKPINTGKGVTKFMFDMKRGDKRGQTSFLK